MTETRYNIGTEFKRNGAVEKIVSVKNFSSEAGNHHYYVTEFTFRGKKYRNEIVTECDIYAAIHSDKN